MQQNETHNYDDIIDLPHHQSATRPHMSLVDRGAQFSPFAALSGYEAAVEEAGRLTDGEIELSEDAMDIIDGRLRLLAENIAAAPAVSILHFVHDSRKEGGAYLRTEGRAVKLDEYARCIVLEGGKTIPIDSVRAIDGDMFGL